MATFGQALEHLKANGLAKREVIKNDTVITVHKNRLYQMSQETGIRYPYVPSNRDLMSDDWVLLKKLSLILIMLVPFFGISQFDLPKNYSITSDLMFEEVIQTGKNNTTNIYITPCINKNTLDMKNINGIQLIKFFDFLSDNNVIDGQENGKAFYWIEKFKEYSNKEED